MHVSAAGIDVWSTPKRGPATPELVASIPSSDVIWASEETIPIDGGGFWGLRLEVWPPDDGETLTLPIGIANRRIAAFFPSRREVARAHTNILALITTGQPTPPA